jgi:flavin reductase (DIM6/NTAB) family NADH-FMN oxidoreductase RutF
MLASGIYALATPAARRTPVAIVTPQTFIEGMRQLAAGVTLITTAHEGHRAGLTATAVCSVSAEPPQLLACVNRRSETHRVIDRSRVFAVNVLASDQQHLARVFSGATDIHGERRFEQAPWTELTTGAPVLSSCLASFDCRVVESVVAATHSIFIGRVEAIVLEPDLDPLVYVEGDYGLIAPLFSPAD